MNLIVERANLISPRRHWWLKMKKKIKIKRIGSAYSTEILKLFRSPQQGEIQRSFRQTSCFKLLPLSRVNYFCVLFLGRKTGFLKWSFIYSRREVGYIFSPATIESWLNAWNFCDQCWNYDVCGRLNQRANNLNRWWKDCSSIWEILRLQKCTQH